MGRLTEACKIIKSMCFVRINPNWQNLMNNSGFWITIYFSVALNVLQLVLDRGTKSGMLNFLHGLKAAKSQFSPDALEQIDDRMEDLRWKSLKLLWKKYIG